jgi:HSP20 family protein
MKNYYMVPRSSRRYLRHAPAGFNGGRRVPLDVLADSEAYVITAAVPGLKAEDLHIEILDDVVTLRGEIQEDRTEESNSGDYLLRELHYGSFTRTLRLPDPLDTDSAEAAVVDGVLTVRIPKAEGARPKEIEVKAN